MELVTPELGTFLWMFFSFAILMFILKTFAWKPILNALSEREDSIDNALKSAQTAKEEMLKLQANNEIIMNKARLEREQMLKETKQLSDGIIAEAKKMANKESDKLILAARINIQSEKETALKDIKNQVASISVDIAEKVLKTKFAEDQQQKDYFKNIINDIKLN